MSEPLSAGRGYTLRLAIRHLTLGLSRPRAVVREARLAGLSELGRLALLAACVGLIVATNAELREGFLSYVGMVVRSSSLWLMVAGSLILVSVSSIVMAVGYLTSAIFSLIAVFIIRHEKLSLADIRTAISLACWIITIPIQIGESIEEYLDYPALFGIQEIPIVSCILMLIALMYFTFCFSEATATPLSVSGAAAVFGMVGAFVGVDGVLAGLERIIAIVRASHSEAGAV